MGWGNFYAQAMVLLGQVEGIICGSKVDWIDLLEIRRGLCFFHLFLNFSWR